MRVISQDGMTDIPYDLCVIDTFSGDSGENAVIYAQCIYACGNSDKKLAEYSNVKKALKAIQMLHDAYMAYFQSERLFRFPADNEITD